MGTSISVLNVSLINILVFTVDRRVLGFTNGLNSLFRNMGAPWGPAIAGTLMGMYAVYLQVPTTNGIKSMKIPGVKSYEYLFLFSAILYVLLIIIAPFIKEGVKIEEP